MTNVVDAGQEQKKAPVFLVLSTKGGTGKSVISQQVLATYNLARHGSSEIIELDDENLDSSWLTESATNAQQIQLGEDAEEFASAVGSAVNIGASGVVVDVGGNRTAKIVIKELSRLSSRVSQIDAVCIPVSDNRMGVENAIKTLETIKESPMAEKLLSKCFIALNRVLYRKVTSVEDKAIQRRFDRVVSMVEEWDLPVLIVHDMDGVENTCPLGLTVMEIAENRVDLVDSLSREIITAHEAGDYTLQNQWDNLQWAVNKATDDFWPSITLAHKQLDTVLEKLATTDK